MGRAPCCEDRQGLKKGAWTAQEDEKLVSFIKRNKGHGSWRTLPMLAGLERCGKSCRLRWTNYLRPNIKRGNFSVEEEHIIIQLHSFMGNKWSSIASNLPGRTDNEVKNHWNTHLKKRLAEMGVDPTTHLPLQFFMPQRNHDAANYFSLLSNNYNTDEWKRALLQRSLQLDPVITCHLVQWELATLEAEARMQIAAAGAAASSHDHMQSYTAWLQSLHQNQNPAYNLNDYMQCAINLQLQATTTPVEPLQPASQYCEAIEDQFLIKKLNLLESEENQCLGASFTPETCSSESTSHLVVCDDLLSSSNEMAAGLNPLSPDDAHHSYWNKMLNLLGPVTVDNL